MVRWILSLASDARNSPQPGQHGFFTAEATPGIDPSLVILTAEYTDRGNVTTESDDQVIPSLKSESSILLHSKRKRAAFADRTQGGTQVDVFEGGVGLVARLKPHGWIAFDELRLGEVDRITVQLEVSLPISGRMVLCEDSPQGRELGSIRWSSEESEFSGRYRSVTIPVTPQPGLTNLYVVYQTDLAAVIPSSGIRSSTETPTPDLSIAWIEFHESAATQQKKLQAKAKIKKILLIPTKLDHPWATHMYSDVCRLMAATLNLTPGVEAVVSPDLDWPKDESLLEDIDAIVYYSRPAGDILLASPHRSQAEKLLQRGVGFSAIHWSTGAETNIGPVYESILGGWFNFEFSGLVVDQQPLQQVAPDHPICRGWDSYLLRDEFYLNLRFHPDAIPMLKVHTQGQDQTVAWVHHRTDGGRSFGTTLGHFHENFADERFRRMLSNGILWTAGVEIPVSGLPVEIPDSLVKLEDPTLVQRSKEWTFAELRPLLLKSQRQIGWTPSFDVGQRLFQKASCSTCHQIGAQGATSFGPDLTDIRVKMAVSDDPQGALLKSILEPSIEIEDRYRSELIRLDDGAILSGFVKEDKEGKILIADDPLQPARLKEISIDQIEDRRKSEASFMPGGLLNSLSEFEILELLTYIESGGNSAYVSYVPTPSVLEPWADSNLPVKHDLHVWLDASRINPARASVGLPEFQDGSLVGVWQDASGNHQDFLQRRLESQPRFRSVREGNWVEFDGSDDLLATTTNGLRTQGFTAMIVVAPNHNRDWPGLLSANAFGKNDYQSGFNIDLMNEPTSSWQTLMSEGPGYQGVINMMTEDHPWGNFQIVTLRSQPGREGVLLRINGRSQLRRDRPDAMLQLDELTLGARYWSNDPLIPPYNRGFLDGRVVQVLLYKRPLSEEELVANEVYLWSSNRSLLETERLKQSDGR
jgi:putative heme-binding domain-containing protein